MKRSVPAISKVVNPDTNFHIKSEHGMPIFKPTNISENQIPEKLHDQMKNIYDTTQEYLKDNPDYFSNDKKASTSHHITENNVISRGISLKTKGEFGVVAGGMASTSNSLSVAKSFAGFNGDPTKTLSLDEIKDIYKNHGLVFNISDSQAKYLKNITIPMDNGNPANNEFRMSLNYDAKAMAKDGRIFALLDGQGFQNTKKAAPELYQHHNESEVMAIF